MQQQELLLMAHLRQNSRTSLTRLSRKTGMPVSTIFDKIKRREGNVIQKHISLINFSELGFSVKVSILLRVGKNQKNMATDFLKTIFNVNSLAKVNNGYDFLLEAIFHNLKELEEFFELLESKFVIKKKEVYYVVEELKKEEFMADPQLLPYVTACS